MFSNALQVLFEQIHYATADKPDIIFWTRLKEKTFELAGKWLEHLERGKIFCLHRPDTFKAATGQIFEFLMRWIHCLYNNVTYRLYAATNQSVNDRRDSTLRLDTSQIVLIQYPIVHWVYWIESHHGEIWREQFAYFRVERLALAYFDGTNCAWCE